MKNYEVYLNEIGLEKILQEIARTRLKALNEDLFDPGSFSCANYACDSGEEYYWMDEAIKAEIKWLNQEAEE